MSRIKNYTATAIATGVALTIAAATATSSPPTVPTGARPLPVNPPAETSFHRYVITYKAGTTQRTSAVSALANARAALTRSGVTKASINHIRRTATGSTVIALTRKLDASESKSLMMSLKADPAVASVSPDRMMYRAAINNDPFTATHQWHFTNSYGGLYAPGAWDMASGEGVVVAVLDTGKIRHPDMDANMLDGYDFITDPAVSRRDTNERVPGGWDLGDWTEPGDCWPGDMGGPSSFHGAHVAGTIAEVTNNGEGMAGVAPNAKVLPVRVLGRCGGYTSDIADAIIWAAGGHIDGVEDNKTPAEVINMSLGGGSQCTSEEDRPMQDAINFAVSRGSVVVVAAGNQGEDAQYHSPASCDNVITVGSNGITGARAFYSNYGDKVDVTAPGGGGYEGNPNGYVWSIGNTSNTSPELGQPVYVGMMGTSMAAPHVAGVVALMQSVAPRSPAEVEATLKATARPFPKGVVVPMGTGIVNAKAALVSLVGCNQGANCEANATAMANQTPVRTLSGAVNSERLYKIEVPAGRSYLSLMTYGGTGDVSLIVRYGQTPLNAVGQYDMGSFRPGNSETVRFAAVYPGTYYVKVIGKAAYNGVTLEARY